MITQPFTLENLRAAHARIADAVHRTPLIHSRTLSERVGTPVHLKCENLQKTGSFKVRGALNRIGALTREERDRGVITISAGNHAQAVAWAADAAGVRSTVVMPERASPTKVRASREYGAEVILHGNAGAAFRRAFEIADERGLVFVHPFDDPDVVAGHASCMLEILDALPDAASVVVPVGGGGLASGIAVATAAAAPNVGVWGVEPEGAAAMHASLEAGEPLHLDSVDTVADGLGAPMAGRLNFEILSAHARGVVLVNDDEIIHAMRMLLERTKLLAEPAGAAGLAALLAGRVPVPEGPVVVVLSGGNVDLEQLGSILVSETS
ncbi:MAG: threonine/serine dehydratase [Gemmatimonadota bacterium]|nr:threonine/serine dehydratase [Gemmatimonadota bacterium]